MNPSDPNQITRSDAEHFFSDLKEKLRQYPESTLYSANPNRNGLVYGPKSIGTNTVISELVKEQILKGLTNPAPVSMSVHVMSRDDGHRSKVFRTQCDGIEMVMPLPPGEYVEQPAEWHGSVPHPKAKYYDPLSFGTASYEPDMISHIDVVDAAGNRVDVMAVPTRCLQPAIRQPCIAGGITSDLTQPVIDVKSIGECWLSETEVEHVRETYAHLLDESMPRAASDVGDKEDK